MFDWDRMEQRRQQSIAAARNAKPGLPREQLVPGAIITLSPNLSTGDRSYTDRIFEVVGRNEGHLLVKQCAGNVPFYSKGPHLLTIHEHEFYGAEHLLEHAEPLKMPDEPKAAEVVSIRTAAPLSDHQS